MLVTVTGGTGFVGAHSIAAIVGAGHRVRMLVRAESTARTRRLWTTVDPVLAMLSVDRASIEVVLGDVTDEQSVASAVRGVDAVLHAAAVYSFDSRASALMRRTNERAAQVAHETMGDTVRWLYASGRLSARQAGAAAVAVSPVVAR